MLEIPNLPHDNLYKFIAFAGLAILIGVNYLYYSLDAQYESQFIGNAIERTKLEFEDKGSHDEAVKWLEEDDRLNASGEAKKPEHRQQNLDLNKRMRENRLKEFEIKAKEITTGILYDRRYEAWWLYWIGSVLGIGLVILGTRFWYVRVQRPQDEFLKSQVSKKTKEY